MKTSNQLSEEPLSPNRVGCDGSGSASDGIHALAIVRGMRERIRELAKLARIGELAIAAQKSTDYYCNESTIQPSEEDWRIDGTEERVWHCGIDLRAAIDAGVKEGAK